MGYAPQSQTNCFRTERIARALTADESGAQRVAWTDTWLKARDWFRTKWQGLPVEEHQDTAGNRYLTLKGESAKALLLGSNLDSVPNGGWLDGALGMLAGFEVLRRFAKLQRAAARCGEAGGLGR